MSKPNITLYTSKYSPPCRVVWMTLKALGLEYTLKEVDLGKGEQKTSEFLAINPSGKVPGITDGDFNMGESRAIATYLCNKYEKDGKLYPKDPQARARVDQLLYLDERVIGAMYTYMKPFPVLILNQKPGLGNEDEMKKSLAIYDEILSKNSYLAGDHMTLADLCGLNSVSLLLLCDYKNLGVFPHLSKWLDTMRKLSYYEECIGHDSKELAALYQSKINA